MRRLIARAIIATATLAAAACEGSPFNPYGKTQQDECHPEKWLDVSEPARNTSPSDSILAAHQAACKAARESGNSR